MSKNTELWDSVKETPTKHTKPGLNNLTSINGHYFMMRATEVFGPCGVGWGYEILEERLDKGVEVNHETSPYTPVTHTLKLRLWYKWNDERGEVVHFGHTPYIMKTKRGPYQDDEAPKKSLTDALKKCLSMIGIGADVHLGQFEDFSYKQELELKEKEEKEIEQERKTQEIKDGISNSMAEAKLIYENSTTPPALNATHKKTMTHVRRECAKLNADPEPMIKALTNLYETQKEKIKCQK